MLKIKVVYLDSDGELCDMTFSSRSNYINCFYKKYAQEFGSEFDGHIVAILNPQNVAIYVGSAELEVND